MKICLLTQLVFVKLRLNRREGILEFKTVKIDKPEDLNFILGQSHFIKTVEDLIGFR